MESHPTQKRCKPSSRPRHLPTLLQSDHSWVSSRTVQGSYQIWQISAEELPEVLRTDNGPPFNSREFVNFVNHYGCHHHRVMPRWPRANGEAERFMRNIKKIVQTAAIELKNWKQELYVFLRNYRATPHTVTQTSPHKALFGREPKTKIPTSASSANSHRMDTNLKNNDEQARLKIQYYANKRAHSHRQVHTGDTVLMKNDMTHKSAPTFNPSPALVIDVKGTQAIVEINGRKYRRNISQLKKLTPQTHSKGLPVAGRQPEVSPPEKIPNILITKDKAQGARDNRNVPPPTTRRYPTRERSAPTYLSDYRR